MKRVKLLFNQGPDPSLVYRPDVDPEMAKSKDSFRNYAVSDFLAHPSHLLSLPSQVSGPALWRAALYLPAALRGLFWKPHSTSYPWDIRAAAGEARASSVAGQSGT